MLVLDRKPGESIDIGENIRVTVLQVRGRLKLGIEAPVEIPVHRSELPAWKRVKRKG